MDDHFMATLRGRGLLKLPDSGAYSNKYFTVYRLRHNNFLIKEVDAAVSPYRLRRVKAIDEVP